MTLVSRLSGAARALFAAEKKPTIERPMLPEIGAAYTSGAFAAIASDTIEWNPDLRGQAGLEQLDKMAGSDPTAGACLNAYRSPLMAAEWDVEPASDDSQHVDEAEFVREQLFGLDVEWADIVDEAFEALTFGFYAFELVWEMSEGQAWLTRLAPRPPRELDDVLSDGHGRFFGVTQTLTPAHVGIVLPQDVTMEQPAKAGLVFIPADKLLMISRRRRGANWAGRSLLRASYKPWWIKHHLEMIAGIAFERRSVGVDVLRLIKSGIGGKPNDAAVAYAEKLMMAMHAREGTYFVEPEGYEYRVEGLQGSVLDPTEFIKYCDVAIARGMSAEFVTMGGTDTGSFAMHADKSSLFMQGLNGVVQDFVRAVNVQVIQRIIRYNFDPQRSLDECPKLTHSRLDKRDITAVSAAVTQLATAKLLGPISEADVNALRTLAELPEVEMPEDGVLPQPGDGPIRVQPFPGQPALPGDGFPNGQTEITYTDFNDDGVPVEFYDNKCVSERIRYWYKTKGKPHKQAIAIAINECERGKFYNSAPDTAASAGCGCSKVAALSALPKSAVNVTAFADGDEIRADLIRAREAIMADAKGEQSSLVASMVAYAEERFAKSPKTLLKPEVDVDGLADVFAEHLQQLALTGESQVANETVRQMQARVPSALAERKPVDPGKLAQRDTYLTVRGASLAAKVKDQLLSAYRFSLLPMIRTGTFNAAVLTEALGSLALAEVAKAARLAVSEALAMGRQAQQAELEADGQVEHYVYSTMTESDTCAACAALDGTRIEPGSQQFQDYYPPLRNGPLGPCEGADGCNCELFAILKS